MTEEEIKEIRDIILQQGKYKKNKNKEHEYIYYEDLEQLIEQYIPYSMVDVPQSIKYGTIFYE